MRTPRSRTASGPIPRAVEGFTLVEILVVAVLVSLFTGTLFVLASTGQRAWARTDAQLANLTMAQKALDQLSGELRVASKSSVVCQPDQIRFSNRSGLVTYQRRAGTNELVITRLQYAAGGNPPPGGVIPPGGGPVREPGPGELVVAPPGAFVNTGGQVIAATGVTSFTPACGVVPTCPVRGVPPTCPGSGVPPTCPAGDIVPTCPPDGLVPTCPSNGLVPTCPSSGAVDVGLTVLTSARDGGVVTHTLGSKVKTWNN